MPVPDFILLNNAALVHQGVLSILGAGTAGTTVPTFPAQVSLGIATRIVWEPEDLGKVAAVRVIARHYDGEVIADVQFPLLAAAGPPELPPAAVLAIPVPLLVRRVGIYQIEFRLDGELLKTMEHVVTTTQPST